MGLKERDKIEKLLVFILILNAIKIILALFDLI